MKKKEEKFCTACGHVGLPRRVDKSSTIVFLLLLVIFFPAAIFYAIWGSVQAYMGCRNCDAKEIIPLNSPIAQRMLAEQRSGNVPATPVVSAVAAAVKPTRPYQVKGFDARGAALERLIEAESSDMAKHTARQEGMKKVVHVARA